MISKYSCILLASGGMDSTVLAYKLLIDNENPLIIIFNYGQHCFKKEFETLKLVVPKAYENSIRLVDISDVYSFSKSRMIVKADLWKNKVIADDLYLPYRNLLFLTIGAAIAQTYDINNVYSAFINSNHAKEIDCSKKFFDEMEVILKEYGPVKIHMPFRNMTKTEVATLGLHINAPIALTYSCQVNSANPCGVCPNCVDRLEAIKNIMNNPREEAI